MEEKVNITYYNDPICPTCWGMEPHMKKFLFSYEHLLNVDYKMGGLLPYWEQYSSVLISRPLDVANDWDNKSVEYEMPIDGDLWREDPVESSFPASIAFKAIEIQNKQRAIKYLRIIREMALTKKINITKWKYLYRAAKQVGADLEKFKSDYDGQARELFYKELEKAKALGIKIFPTIIMTNSLGHQVILKGFQHFETLQEELMRLYFKTKKKYYNQEGICLFDNQSSLTTKEFAELKNISFDHAEAILHRYEKNNKLKSHKTKNGLVWTKNKITIIGGGIAGLTLGNLLEKKQLEYQVFEKRNEEIKREEGIMISEKGIQILESIIPRLELNLAGIALKNYKSYDHTGELISKSVFENTYIFSRNKLIELLQQKIPSNKIYDGLELKDLHLNKSRIDEVKFNGTNSQSITPEIVIAADGAKSRVREKLFPNIELSPVPENEIVSIISNKKLAKKVGNTFKKYIHKDGDLALGIIRMSKKKVIWFVQFNADKYNINLETANQKKKIH
ncbi:MAG: DsbA family protein [Parvicellaceae bacterium]